MLTYSRQFQNELGNTITVRASAETVSGVPGILVAIIGPESDTELEVTRQEALELLEGISRVLNLKRR